MGQTIPTVYTYCAQCKCIPIICYNCVHCLCYVDLWHKINTILMKSSIIVLLLCNSSLQSENVLFSNCLMLLLRISIHIYYYGTSIIMSYVIWSCLKTARQIYLKLLFVGLHTEIKTFRLLLYCNFCIIL